MKQAFPREFLSWKSWNESLSQELSRNELSLAETLATQARKIGVLEPIHSRTVEIDNIRIPRRSWDE